MRFDSLHDHGLAEERSRELRRGVREICDLPGSSTGVHPTRATCHQQQDTAALMNGSGELVHSVMAPNPIAYQARARPEGPIKRLLVSTREGA